MPFPALSPSDPAGPRPPPPWVYAAAALAYFGLVWLGLWSTAPSDEVAPIWLCTGLGIWLTLRFGPAMLIVLAVGEFAANVLYYASTAETPEPISLSAMISGNVLTAYLGARLWHGSQSRWRTHLGDFCEPVCCTVVAFAAPLVAATVGTGVLVASGTETPERAPGVWLAWWTSNAIGALFMLPLLLALPALRHRLRHAEAGDFLRGVLLFGLSAGTVAVVYGLPANTPYHFALFPLLILATAWFGAPGSRLLAFLLASGGIVAAALGRGPFATGQNSDDLVSAELFLAAGGLIALLLPAIQTRRTLLRPLPLALLLGGWLGSGLLVADLIKQHRRGDAADFAQLAANAEAVIGNRIVNYVAVLRSARSFVLGKPTVTSASWRDFVQSLNLPTDYPGLRGVGLVYPVPPEELGSFLARVRADGAPEFKLHPLQGETLSATQPHFILTYLERVIPTNQNLLGLDVGSQALRRKLLEAARDTGRPQIAPHPDRTRLGSGFTLYLPVYELGAPVSTVAERRAALRAWVHAGFGTDAFLQGVLGARRDKMDFYLFEPGPLDLEHLIYATTSPGKTLPEFRITHSRRLFDQAFTFAWNSGPAFVTASLAPLIWLAVGLAVGVVLLTGWVHSLETFRERAEALVEDRTSALRASESRSRLLVRAAHVGLWDWDLITGALYFSPEWKAQLGYADHELPTSFETWESRLHPEDRSATLAAVADFQAGGRSDYDVEFRLRHRDGSWRWILTQAELTRDPQRRAVRMIGSHIDITTRKTGEALLRASDRRFNDLVNSTDGIVWEADATTFAFTSISANAERLLGYPVTDWLKPGFWAEHIHPDDRERTVHYCATCTGRLEDHDFEYRFMTAAGEVRWLRDVVRVIPENESPRWLRSLMIDITAQKAAVTALQQSEARLRALLGAIPDLIFEQTADGEYLAVHASDPALLLVPVEDLLHRNISEFLPAPIVAQALAAFAAALAERKTQVVHYALTRDGSERHFEARIAPSMANTVLVIVRDVTERSHAEVALRVSEERARAIIDSSPVPMALNDEAEHITFLNPAFTETFGYELADIPTLDDWWPKAYPDPVYRQWVAETWRKEVNRSVQTDTAFVPIELTIRCKDGTERTVLASASPLENAFAGVHLVALQDITARRQAEENLRANEARLYALFEFSSYAIWDEDFSAVRAFFDRLRSDGVADFRAYFEAHPGDVAQCAALVKIRAINQQTVRLLEASSKADIFTHIQDYFDAAALNVFREELIALAEGESFFAGDIPLRLPNGKRIICAFQLAVVPGSERTLDQVLVTFEDVTARRLHEQTERESAMQLSLVIRGGDIGYWDWNFVTGDLVVNDRWFTLLGLDPQTTRSSLELWSSLVHPDDLPELGRRIKEIILNPACVDGEAEIRARHTSGHYIWILEKFSIVARDSDGSPLRVVGTHLDITARKESELELLRSKDALTEAQRIAHLGSWELDVARDRMTWSEELCRINGVDPAVLPLSSAARQERVTPESWIRLTAAQNQSLATGHPFELEVEILQGEGRPGWLWVRGETVRDAQGAAFGLRGVAQDITGRKLAEAALHLNQLVIENISQGVIVTGPDRLILSVNAAFSAITGYSRTDALGRDCKFLVGPLTDPVTTAAIRSALRSGSVFAGEIQNHRKDGTPFWNELTITPVFDARGSLTHFIGVTRDFTGRKRIEEEKTEVEAQLRQSQKLEGIGQLSGGIAHDFNNLLTAILGYTTLLQDEPRNSPTQQEMLDQIAKAGNRAASLTRQLLLFSRRETPVRHDVDLNHVVAELFKMLRRLLGENIDIHLALTAQPQVVHADAGMLDQVLLNLAVNARDAMPRGGKLTIATQPVTFTATPDGGALKDSRNFDSRAPFPNQTEALPSERPPTAFAFRREGNFTCLSVIDEGCGIPPEAIDRIFEPFYTTKEEGKGTGLGLATVYGAVQMHEGWIEVKSQPDQGSSFQVYLPRIPGGAIEEVSAPRASLEKSGRGETILIVEDETLVRLATRVALERSGYRVLDCNSGAAALELWPAHRDRVELVITDMMMPGGVSGADLIKQLTAVRRELPFILMSGYSATLAEDLKALPTGFKFLSKPFPLEVILSTVRASLDAKARPDSRPTG